MSILNNISAVPNYELKYELQFTSRADNTYKVEIHEKDGAAGVPPIQMIGAGSRVFSIKQSFSDQDIFREVAGTQYTLRIITTNHYQYTEFRYANNRQFYMKLWKKADSGGLFIQIGSGYYMPETFEQDHGGGPDAVMLRFTDNLGILKYEHFENNDGSAIEGEQRVSDIIAFILSKAGSQIRFFDMIPIRPYYGEYSARGYLYNLWVDCFRFRGMSCDEVLRSLIGAVNGQIVYTPDWNWFMFWVPSYITTSYGVLYERDGTIVNTGITIGRDFTLGVDVLYQGRSTKTIDRPIKEIELSFRKELNTNLLEEKLAYITGPTDPPVWTNLYYTNSPYEFRESIVVLAPYTMNFLYINQPNYMVPAVVIPFQKDIPLKKGHIRVKFSVIASTWKINPSRVNVSFYWQVSLGETSFPYNISHKETIPLGGGFYDIERIVEVPWEVSVVALRLTTAQKDSNDDLAYISFKRDWEIITVKDAEGTLYETEETEIIPIDSDNNRALSVEKDYGHNNLIPYSDRPWYTWYNNFACRPGGGDLAIVRNFRYMLSEDEITLPDFVRSTLVNYYLLNKLRVSLSVAAKQYWYIYNLPRPYSKVIIPHLDQDFLFGSYNWNLRMDTYDLELIGYTAKPWVLQDNEWYDGGVWLDQEIWQEE